jgi:hypothetical protein
MNSKIFALLAAGWITGPMAAVAQQNELGPNPPLPPQPGQAVYEYTGAEFTNFGFTPPFSSSAWTSSEYVQAYVYLAGNLAPNSRNVSVTPEFFELSGFGSIDPVIPDEGPSSFQFSTNAAGAITAWNFSVSDNNSNYFTILDNSSSTSGDSVLNTVTYQCPGPGVCTQSASTSAIGSWKLITAAPEIDLGSAGGGLALLLGGLAVLGSGRKRRC